MSSSKPEDSQYGPSLPPNFLKMNDNVSSASDKLKPSIGPQLPPELREKYSESGKETNCLPLFPFIENSSEPEITQSKINKNQNIGPELPPHLKINQSPESGIDSKKIIGPSLPPHFKDQFNKILPKLRPETSQLSSDDEVDVYGPVPIGVSHSKAHLELEERALQMKIDLLNPRNSNEPSREEWMVELPPSKASNLGLGPRQFRCKEAPDLSDRSLWTDTPEDRAKKKEPKQKEQIDIKKEAARKELIKRDNEQEEIAKKHKRSKESLVEMHMKKKKKEEESTGRSERRPFSREVDLKVNRFDEAQKKAVLKKAHLLDTRFSSGESKYL